VHAFTVAKTPEPASGVHDDVESRESDHADERTVLVNDGKKIRIERNTARKGFCSVNRINDPRAIARSGMIFFFLAQDGVVRSDRGDPLADETLGRPIGFGDGRAITFAVNGEIMTIEPLEGELSRVAGHLDGGIQQ
jgi:hypothetical protein